jgi:hypothetical protein
MSAGYILAAADITAAADVSAVEFVAVAEDTPVVATMATGKLTSSSGNYTASKQIKSALA